MAGTSLAPTSGPGPNIGMGAVLQKDGCTFRTWAPFAEAVFVAGSFTAPPWTVRIPLARDNPAQGSGHDYWSVKVNGVLDRAEYKFITQRDGNFFWKLDPYCRDATGVVDGNGVGQANNSIVDNPAFDWGDHQFQMPNWNELVIYEMHIGTFNNVNGKSGNFDEALGKLDYLKGLGINAIEVMPVSGFEPTLFPFTSMGYNPSQLFAIDSAYGTQKAVQKFVQAAHIAGIAVLFDVVYNHFGPDTGDCLYQFDGWSLDGRADLGGIYFYSDDRTITDYGENRPDYGRPEVRQFIVDNAMMWLHEYQADGLRFDSTFNIRRAISHDNKGTLIDRGDIPEGWGLMQRINYEKDSELPWNLTIAEDLQNNEWITKETSGNGAGFNSQWDVSFFGALKDAVTPSSDDSRNIEAVASAVQQRYNGDAFRRVIYSESHDEVKIPQGRMPEKIWPGNATSFEARKRSTLAAAITFTAPGIPMIFQGQEFLEWGSWSDNPSIDPNAMLDWNKQKEVPGSDIYLLYKRLITLRLNRDHNTRGLTGQNLNVFHVNDSSKVLAYHRYMEGGPGDDVLIVANFSHNAFDSYTIGFPRTGNWYLRFNSDWSGYGSDFTNKGYDTTASEGGRDGLSFSGNVGIGPYSAIILSQ